MRRIRDIYMASYVGYEQYRLSNESIGFEDLDGPIIDLFNNLGNRIDRDKSHILVFTHGGTFHGDEMSALGMLVTLFPAHTIDIMRMSRSLIKDVFGKGPEVALAKIRTLMSDDDVIGKDTFAIVLDIGGHYNHVDGEDIAFLDHHQSSSLPASNKLLANLLLDDTKLKYALNPFMERVSNIDIAKSEYDEQPTEFTAIIRSFNTSPNDKNDFSIVEFMMSHRSVFDVKGEDRLDNQLFMPFIKALAYSIVTVSKVIAQCIITNNTSKEFLALPTMNGFKVSTVPGNFPNWQEVVTHMPNVHGLIVKNTQEAGFVIICSDTTVYKLEPGFNEVFIHNSGFMAKYTYFEDAMRAIGVGAINQT